MRSSSRDHLAGRLIAVGGVAGQHLANDGVEGRRARPGRFAAGEGGGSACAFRSFSASVSPGNGTSPGEQEVQRAAEAEQVAPGVGLPRVRGLLGAT